MVLLWVIILSPVGNKWGYVPPSLGKDVHTAAHMLMAWFPLNPPFLFVGVILLFVGVIADRKQQSYQQSVLNSCNFSLNTLFCLCYTVSRRSEERHRKCEPQLFNWLFFISPTYIATPILNESLTVLGKYLLRLISQIRQPKTCTRSPKEAQGMKAGTTLCNILSSCQSAMLSFTEITPTRSSTSTRTEISSTNLHATLSL